MKKDSIGLAMITRDCAETLQQCLLSVYGLFDQVVIVDTGSVDNTVAVAKKFDAEVYHFQWVDDFAAARNESFNRLKTEWAFWIDSDDVIVGREYLEDMLQKCTEQNLRGVVLEYLYAFDSVGERFLAEHIDPVIQRGHLVSQEAIKQLIKRCVTTQYRERLVRNDPSWRWVYPVHEALPSAGHKLGKYDKIKIIHRRHTRKRGVPNRRNLDILLKVPSDKYDERILFYLGLEHAQHQEFEAAISAFERYLPKSTVSDEKYLALHFLGDLYRFKGDLDRSVSYDLQAVALRPTWRDAYAGLLETHVKKQDWNLAIYYGAMTKRAEIPETPFAINPLHEEIGWVGDYVRALMEVGQLEEALAESEIASSRVPEDLGHQHNVDTLSVALNLRRGQQAVADAAEFFLRHDDAETAGLIIARSDPVVRDCEAIRKWIRIAGVACGAASRGDIPREELRKYEETWDEPRVKYLFDHISQMPEVKTLLQVGGPLESSILYKEYGLEAKRVEKVDEIAVGSYDAVVLWNCLERVKLPDVVVSAARQVINPGGYFFSFVSNGPSSKGLAPPSSERARLRAYSVDAFRQVMGTVRMPALLGGGPADSGDLALMIPMPIGSVRGRNIAMVCPLAPEIWGPESLGRGIGGSEEAVIRLSRAFTRRGHCVTVYGSGFVGADVGPWGEISYKPISGYTPTEILIGWRHPEIFLNQVRPLEAGWRGLWLHDSIGRERVEAASQWVDAIWCISNYHASLYSGIPKIYIGRNGIDPWEIAPCEDEQEVEKRRNLLRMVYVSSPFRGLNVLLGKYWPTIVGKFPQAEMHCYYGWDSADRMGVTATPEGAEYKRQVMGLVGSLPNITWHGRIGQKDLYNELLSSGVWCYPSTWREENCCAAGTMISIPGDHRGGPPRVPIESLVGKSGFPVWTYDEAEDRFKIGTAVRVWQTKIASELVEVLLDDGQRLRVTPEHLLLIRDGQWVQAGDVQVGQRLMALHHRYQVMVKDVDGDWISEHRLVGEWLAKRPLLSGEVVDHLDLLRLDNRAEMLQVMSVSEHSKKTSRGITRRKSTEPKRIAAIREKWATDMEWRARKVWQLQGQGKKLWEMVRSLPQETQLDWLRKRGEAKKRTYARMRIEDSERYAGYAAKWAENGRSSGIENRAAERWARKRQNNHRVVSVRRISGGPVYDMEVEGTHTFVAEGVVVHNCISAYLAQACGAWPVVFPLGALGQSVVFGWKVDDAHFVEAVCDAAQTTVGRQRMMEWARKWLSWDDVATSWERLWLGRLA